MSQNKFTAGKEIIYNDGRQGHQDVTAVILESDERKMIVQFEDRADTTTIFFNQKDWMNFITIKAEEISTVRCNKCNWRGREEDLILIEFDVRNQNETPTAIESSTSVERFNTKPVEVDFLNGCPNCKTDAYLIDIE